MTAANLLHAKQLTLRTSGGRPLFRDLTLALERGDRVALVGRNGIGKSTLLRVLAGQAAADSGEVFCSGERVLVPQSDPSELAASGSPGELRLRRLQRAFAADPDLLLLDEPTHDLDRAAQAWLARTLTRFRRALVLVSHDRRLLAGFQDFFVVSENGCRHVSGGFDALRAALALERDQSERRHVNQLRQLTDQEQHRRLVEQRAQRKQNVGRIRELERCTPRIRLNSKRAQAQQSQAKRRLIQEDRGALARSWALATRRALRVDLPLAAALPELPEPSARPIVALRDVSARAGERRLIEGLTLQLERQRLAVTGPNGSGKSTLLALMAGERAPDSGQVLRDPERLGYIAQNCANFALEHSLLQQLVQVAQLDTSAAASCLRAHKFPFALAQRPLASLSPGERLRAALIGMLQRPSPPELLLLDEPTSHLDFLGYDALCELLMRWRGGLVIASHDEAFLQAVGIDVQLAPWAASAA